MLEHTRRDESERRRKTFPTSTSTRAEQQKIIGSEHSPEIKFAAAGSILVHLSLVKSHAALALVKYGLNLCVFTKHTYRMAHSKVLLQTPKVGRLFT